MAGIWEYVTVTGEESQRRLNVMLLRTELTGVALGVTTRAAARVSLETELGAVLPADAVTDLNAIADQFDAGTTQQRLVYAHKLEYALNAAELRLITEAAWRSVLNIAAL